MNAMTDYYSTERGVSEYLLFHYGKAGDVLPYPFGPADALDFPVRCVRDCVNPDRLTAESRGLDLGCAVGRSSFELARVCGSVVGVDFSAQFIEAARRLLDVGQMTIPIVEQGRLTRVVEVSAPRDVDRSRVRFETGDAHDLRDDLGQFDVVLMANLIDRLREPRACLRRLPALVVPGGQLVITSPYTWLEQYTPPANWLGGHAVDHQPVTTLDGLRQLLEPSFTLTATKDLPFLIREHARKFQWSVAEASIWLRA